jgi:hypothetical protein
MTGIPAARSKIPLPISLNRRLRLACTEPMALSTASMASHPIL